MTANQFQQDPALADALTRRLARQALFDKGQLVKVHSTVVYAASPCWETECIRQDEQVVKVHNLHELADAMQNPDIATLFIPASAALSLTALKQALEQYTLDKTIFIEQ